MTIHDQISATSANLIAISKLLIAAPDLFEHTSVSLAQVDPKCARLYIHAYNKDDVDWRAIALKYSRANWKRDVSPSNDGRYDWEGTLDGVEVSFLSVEKREVPTPLFAVEGAAA